MRKLFIVFAVVAGLFGLQGSLAMPMPREKARTELVVKYQEQKPVIFTPVPEASYVFISETLQKPQVFSPYLVTLLTSSIYFHSGL